MFSVSEHAPSTATSTSGTWRNWGRTESVVPAQVRTPRAVDDVAAAIADARAGGLTVKPVGSGHSFSAIALAPGIQLDMSAMRGLVSVDADTAQATFRAGTTLHEIPDLLAPHGLAMPNLGDVDAQTLSGATSTGTHGTGAAFGGISTQIVGLEIVTGTGEVRRIDGARPELLSAAALGLGALGVVTEITLQCVPSFGLHAYEGPEPIDDVIDSFLDSVAVHDHYEFYWFPHTGFALTKKNVRVDADVPAQGPGRVRRYIDDELLSNGLFGVLCAVGARAPKVVPKLNSLAANALSARTYIDSSTRVFVSSRTVRFREMEYALPIERIPEALNQIRELIIRRRYRISFPLEVRAAAADDLMLSTAGGRASGYIAVHRFHRDRMDGYFDDVEEIMVSHGGRPHWGKMHTRDAGYLRTVYPRFDDFLAVRADFDPDRVFANPYLHSVLGA
ncbi:FAD-binding protein [Gordonia rubripertincta]|uniref:FAD-binding protein n=1 Tax=Gordonia rubripertincta TaxID=36822 RepID=A0ABT4N040_GORRU|nr:D-arabinono-1,4-lactone oxidase [Gordonia rubripertincta]MCZ4552606.1 FAD-binding protein [Gordonia rubripertincta]